MIDWWGLHGNSGHLHGKNVSAVRTCVLSVLSRQKGIPTVMLGSPLLQVARTLLIYMHCHLDTAGQIIPPSGGALGGSKSSSGLAGQDSNPVWTVPNPALDLSTVPPTPT